MTAVLLMQQNEIDRHPDRWHGHRRWRITASQMAIVLGLAPESWEDASPYALYAAKQRGTVLDSEKAELERGRDLEPVVAAKFRAARPGLSVFAGGLWAAADRPWQAATFDGLALDPAEIGEGDGGEVSRFTGMTPPMFARPLVMPVEYKTDFGGLRGWGEPGTGQVPLPYLIQCLHQMDVWDARVVLLAVLDMQRWQLRVYVIGRDRRAELDIAMMREEGAAFHSRLVRGDPPPVDWRPATRKALLTAHKELDERTVQIDPGLALAYQAARTAYDEAVREYEQRGSEVLAAMGDARWAEAVIGGKPVKVATHSRYGQDRYPGALEELRKRRPRIAASLKQTGTVDKIVPGTWVKKGEL